MSYTNPTRASRLRKQAVQQSSMPNDEGQDPPSNQMPEQTTSSSTSTFQHRDGYSVQQPNARKREKIQQTAIAEAKAYENYKQSKKKVQYTTTVGAVGGGNQFHEASPLHRHNPAPSVSSAFHRHNPVPSVSSRRHPIPAQQSTCPARGRGAPSLRSQSLRLDEPEIERHKQAQRKKSEQNQIRESERQKHLDVDRRIKNEAFLSRLEGKP